MVFPLPHRDFSKISKINPKPFLTTSSPSHYLPENPLESVKEDYFGQILSFFQQRNWKKKFEWICLCRVNLINISIFWWGKFSPKILYHKIEKAKKKKKSTWCLLGREDGVGAYSLIVNPGSSSECYVAGCSCKYLHFPPRHSFQHKELFLGRAFTNCLSKWVPPTRSEGL